MKSTSIKSYGSLCSIPSIASFIELYALNNASLCLEFVITTLEELLTSPANTIASILSCICSIPSFLSAEIFIILSFPTISSITVWSIACSKSILFNNTIVFLLLAFSSISKSSSVNGFDESKTIITKSAESIDSLDFCTPIFSTISSVSLIPAVSTIFSGIPLMFTNSSITSLVVPAISVTIALFSPKIEFNNDDLPTFGLPIITVFSPSLRILPLSAESYNFLISSLNAKDLSSISL